MISIGNSRYHVIFLGEANEEPEQLANMGVMTSVILDSMVPCCSDLVVFFFLSVI